MKSNPLLITCPIIGAELTREETPHLPITPDELASAAHGAVDAGAHVIHLHVRDKKGCPSQSVSIFKSVTEKIRGKCDCIIQYSTGGAVGTPLKQRCAPLMLKPEMASLSMGSLNFGEGVFENSEKTIQSISQAITKNGIVPELEIFDAGMMDTVDLFVTKGFLPQKFHVEFVLGVPGGINGKIETLVSLVNRLAKGQTWSVAGMGRFQLPLTAHAIAMGGHVRVGFEDNIFYRKGELALSNAQLIKRVIRIAKELERPLATLREARIMLGV